MRLRLLDRYILRQTIAPFLFALGALTSILLLNEVARRLPKLVGKGLPWSVIGEVFALAIPFIVVMTLPMALLLAVLYAFTHLGADSEITAMKASGISIRQMLTPVLLAGVVMTCVTFYITDQIHPKSNARLKALITDIARKKPTLELAEQAINPIPPSTFFLRAGRVDANSGRLKDVAIYDLGQPDSRRIIYADSGLIGYDLSGVDVRLRLWHGTIHESKTASPDLFQVTDFIVNTLRIREVGNQMERRQDEDALRGDREMSTCELLGKVRDVELETAYAGRESGYLGRSDLRRLLVLPLPQATPVPALRPAGLYCGVFKAIGDLLTTGTAEAQQPTQGRPRLSPQAAEERRRARLGLPGSTTPQPLDSAAASLRRARMQFQVQGTGLALSTFADIQSARAREVAAARRHDSIMVEVHKKWAISAACFVFVLVGVPIALRFPRGGMGIVIGAGLLIFTLADVGLITGESLGKRGVVSPVVAMWSTNALLSVLGLWGLARVNRESGSTRGGDLAELFSGLAAALSRPFRRGRSR